MKLHLEPVDIALEHHLLNSLLSTVVSRAYEDILDIRKGMSQADQCITANNGRYRFLSPLRKLEIRYQAMCGQSLARLEKRCAYVQPP